MEAVENSTMNTTNYYDLQYNKTGWIVAFALVAAGTILSNSLILAVFLETKILHRRSTYLIINLTIADGLVGVISVPLFICIFLEDKVGNVLYNVYAFQDILLGLTSVSSLTFIASERFYAIRFPMKYRALSAKGHIIMILNSWIFGIMVATARILTSIGLIEIKTFTYVMVFSITVPLTVTCVLYIIVWGMTRDKPASGRTHHHENRLFLTLFIITSVFIISWTPFPAANIIVTFWPSLAHVPGFLTYINITKLLHYGNSLLNALIYTLKMSEFRKSLLHLLCRGSLPWRRYGNERPRKYSRSTVTSRLSSSSKRRKTDHSPPENENGLVENYFSAG